MLEGLLRHHLMVHLSSHLLLSDHQYGFHKGRSCALQLIDVIDNWTKAINERDRIDVAYFDFAKVIDTVPTKGLLAKIQSYGIHGNILKRLTSFLTPNDVREFSSTVYPPAGAMSSVVFHKEVS